MICPYTHVLSQPGVCYGPTHNGEDVDQDVVGMVDGHSCAVIETQPADHVHSVDSWSIEYMPWFIGVFLTPQQQPGSHQGGTCHGQKGLDMRV